MTRPTPFLVLARQAETIFPAIRTALEREGRDPTDRDAFLLVPEVVELLHELRPSEGLGEGMDQLVAFVHHAYLFWDAGMHVLPLDGERLSALLGAAPADAAMDEGPGAYYVQLLERQVWAQVLGSAAAEPMDGCFVYSAGERLNVLGIFGLRPGRDGFTAVEVAGPRPHELRRADGTPLFSPVLTGGEAARLHSLVGAEELLELGWRTLTVAGETPVPQE
jgi:hypothetical protein